MKTHEAATELTREGRANTPVGDCVEAIESPSRRSGISLSNANRFGRFQVKKNDTVLVFFAKK